MIKTLIAIALMFLAGTFIDGSKSPPTPRISSASITVNMTKRRFTESEQLLISSIIKNHSDKPLTIYDCWIWPNHRITVLDEQGHEVALTPKGKRAARRFEEPGRDKNVRVQIAPQGSLKTIQNDDLRGYHQIGKGTYRVLVRYRDTLPPTPLDMMSKEFTFIVD